MLIDIPNLLKNSLRICYLTHTTQPDCQHFGDTIRQTSWQVRHFFITKSKHGEIQKKSELLKFITVNRGDIVFIKKKFTIVFIKSTWETKTCNPLCNYCKHFLFRSTSSSGWLSQTSVYYVAVRTIVLSRHGSTLARPVVIHDIIHCLMCMPITPHCGFSGVSPDGNYAYVHWGLRPAQSQSDEPSDLRGSLSPTTRHRCTMS